MRIALTICPPDAARTPGAGAARLEAARAGARAAGCSAQRRLEEFRRPTVGGVRGVTVVRLSADPSESVIEARIVVNGDVGIAGETFLDLLLRLGRHELVGPGDVQHQRLADLRRLRELVLNTDPIVADVGIGDRKSTRLNSSH